MVVNVDIEAPSAPAGGLQGKTSSTAARDRSPGWWRRLAPARLTSRIILINLVGLVILVGGILYFNESRASLIDARVESLMTQGRIMAAAVASSATIDTGRIVIDPDKLLEQQLGDDAAVDLDALRNLEFLIRPEQAGPVLRRLVRSTDTRARIYDREGLLVVDSRYFYGRGDILRVDLPPIDQPGESVLTQWWHSVNDWLFSNDYPVQKEYGLENGKEFPEVTASLNGASVSVVRVNQNNEIIVSVAVPIQRFRAVLGGLVLSTKGGEIDEVLRNERRIVFFTFLIAGLVAVLLSVALASHIAEPIRRLSASADRVRRGINNRVEIPDFSSRRDEVGHLSGSLRDMTDSLYNRIDAIEAFAADVAHELKNPLTSLRSAVETLDYAKTPEQRERLVEIVKDDVMRLDRLITDVSDASRLDAELVRAKAEPVDLAQLLQTFSSISNEVGAPDRPRVELTVQPPPAGVSPDTAFMVLGHDTRLGQVAHNLIGNAVSFSAPGSTVNVILLRDPDWVEYRVEDSGPGMPEGNMEKIFERFYTDRPEGSFGKNSGLGLSISKQIVEAYRGHIWAENRYDTDSPKIRVIGAAFSVRIPALTAGRRST
ncbi:MAG: stimulus-sensing domain-containing protein [Aestuariivirgaceae bacterium]